jgi:hypothetical protein
MAVYRRRRVAVASAIASLVMLVSFASHAAAAVLGGGSGSAGAGASAVVLGRHGGQDLVEGGRYLVQPGDTLWTIARALQPRGDVSGLVHRLERLNGGAPLAIGQQLQLPN